MGSYLDLEVLRNVAVVALIAGLGITVLFSVAVRSLTAAADQSDQPAQPVAAARLLAAGRTVRVGRERRAAPGQSSSARPSPRPGRSPRPGGATRVR